MFWFDYLSAWDISNIKFLDYVFLALLPLKVIRTPRLRFELRNPFGNQLSRLAQCQVVPSRHGFCDKTAKYKFICLYQCKNRRKIYFFGGSSTGIPSFIGYFCEHETQTSPFLSFVYSKSALHRGHASMSKISFEMGSFAIK